MEMDCIPAGMELFPAADEEQWEFIKRVIDDCDYYILIIGGRYGSTTTEGVSYTEKEYDYAISKNLKVLAFVHDKPDEIPVGKSDVDPELRTRLVAFRDKVTTGRLVKSWLSASELPGLVALSLGKTIKSYPAIGWVRANQIASADILTELNNLRKRNQELERRTSQPNQKSATVLVDNLAGLDEKVTMSGTYLSHQNTRSDWKYALTWAELFALIAPYLLEHPIDNYIKVLLASALHKRTGQYGRDVVLSPDDFQTAKVQLLALRLVDVQYLPTVQGGVNLFWSLTRQGHEAMLRLCTVKSKKKDLN
jgi:hypothetical protein